MTRIDTRGMRCPWPAIRLARALRESTGPVEILADDPAAAGELAAVARAAGAEIRSDANMAGRFEVHPGA